MRSEKKQTRMLNGLQEEYRNKVINKIKNVYTLEDRPCFCGSRKATSIFDRDRYGLPLNFVFCDNCGQIRMDPVINEKDYSDFYDNDYRKLYLGENSPTEQFFNSQNKSGEAIVKILNKYGVDLKCKEILEVGCGAGGILKIFQNNGAKVSGVDYDSSYIEYGIRNHGLELKSGGVEKLKEFGRKYDIIVLHHVFEHFADPLKEIREIMIYLKDKESIIFVAVPGLTDMVSWNDFRELFHIAHPFQYTLRTLNNIMARVNLSPLVANGSIFALYLQRKGNLELNNRRFSVIKERVYCELMKRSEFFRFFKNIYMIYLKIRKTVKNILKRESIK